VRRREGFVKCGDEMREEVKHVEGSIVNFSEVQCSVVKCSEVK
jgi:hypothetical protein